MKKTMILLAFAVSTLALCAQEKAIGLRLGGGTYNGGEVTYQQLMGDANRLELDLGFGSNSYFSSMNITGTYQWTFPLADIDGLGWYVGPGAGLGIWSYDHPNDTYDKNGVSIAIGGIIGIDYLFSSVPFQVSLDSRPMINVVGGHSDYNGSWGGALSIRYLF